MSFKLGDTAALRAGFRVYSTAAGATVTTQGYSSALSVTWTKAGALSSIVANIALLVGSLALLVY